MSKRRGFTLTEIVVVIALTSLVLAMVGGCLYFVSTYSGTLISKSEELTKVQTIETYLRGFATDEKGDVLEYLTIDKDNKTLLKSDQDSNQYASIKLENGNLVNQDGEAVIKNTNLKELNFICVIANENESFLKCKLKFQSGNEYTFILGIVKNP